MANQVEPRPTDRREAYYWDRRYSKKFNQDGTRK